MEVRGIDPANLEKLARVNWQVEQWNKLLSLKPLRGTAEEQQQRPAMLGSTAPARKRSSSSRAFRCKQGPLPGRARSRRLAHEGRWPAGQDHADDPRGFGATHGGQPCFPDAGQLPENLLKFYIHFSAPMSQGRVYQHFKLLDEKDKPIAWPWLELDEELWNPDGTRFTLFFDPGRIKQGLKPREDLGPALEKGKKYTLMIDAGWTDAANRPLKASYRKTFTVGEPVEKCPAMETWKLVPGPSQNAATSGSGLARPHGQCLAAARGLGR